MISNGSDETSACDPTKRRIVSVAAAWAVHAYTASGAVLGLLALAAVASGRIRDAFLCMTLATLIDCTDGTLARRARVKTVLPHFDGSRLDDIVDYLNYVVVPIFLALRTPGILPAGAIGFACAALPLLASAYGFCQTDAKTADHYFTGFPSYWNVVVLYLVCLRLPMSRNVLLLVLLSIAVFVPIRYLYPSRTRTLQRTTYVLGSLWAVAVLVMLFSLPDPPRLLTLLSLLFPAYYLGVSFYLHASRPPSPTHSGAPAADPFPPSSPATSTEGKGATVKPGAGL